MSRPQVFFKSEPTTLGGRHRDRSSREDWVSLAGRLRFTRNSCGFFLLPVVSCMLEARTRARETLAPDERLADVASVATIESASGG